MVVWHMTKHDGEQAVSRWVDLPSGGRLLIGRNGQPCMVESPIGKQEQTVKEAEAHLGHRLDLRAWLHKQYSASLYAVCSVNFQKPRPREGHATVWKNKWQLLPSGAKILKHSETEAVLVFHRLVDQARALREAAEHMQCPVQVRKAVRTFDRRDHNAEVLLYISCEKSM